MIAPKPPITISQATVDGLPSLFQRVAELLEARGKVIIKNSSVKGSENDVMGSPRS